jgi:hypothetical protein
MRTLLSAAAVHQPRVTEFSDTLSHLAHRRIANSDRLRQSSQLIFFTIAFKITSCSFIIRSVSRMGITWLVSTSPDSPSVHTGQLTC